MCGIAGFIDLDFKPDELPSKLEVMLKTIHHRGPDSGGMWLDTQHGLALGHRRLSILDLSASGHQPMTSACGRYVLIFNGEIYNHLEMRQALYSDVNWRGHSDTETLLACFVAWGIEKTLKATVGMFAFALWDAKEKILTLARDRIGEKPLYYGWNNDVFLFGSELKCLCAYPTFVKKTDWDAVDKYFHLNYIPAPHSIYQGISKLTPGTFLSLTQRHVQQKKLPPPVSYWSLAEVALKGMDTPFPGTFDDAVDELEILIRNAVKLQSVADVPVGAFLSGGIDSSTVVAMMQSATTSTVTTFSIGMPEAKMDESQHAATVAKHLGTHHVEHIIQPHEAIESIPQLFEIWDEPFADSSQIPTYLVSKIARQQVTVALSGDGGDEFFLGYPQYGLYQKLWRLKGLGKLPWDRFFEIFSPLLKSHPQLSTGLRRAKSIVKAWQQPNKLALNRYWMDKYRQDTIPLITKNNLDMLNFPILQDVATTAGLLDAETYLPDDILVKVDRAAMANSLETRAPLLDHRIVEFACSLPPAYKLDGRFSKKVLREVLYRYVPKQIVDRPKMGFSIPLSSWLKKELRPWAEELLDNIQGDSEHFTKAAIERLWQEHLSAKRDHTDRLWAILSFFAWEKSLHE